MADGAGGFHATHAASGDDVLAGSGGAEEGEGAGAILRKAVGLVPDAPSFDDGTVKGWGGRNFNGNCNGKGQYGDSGFARMTGCSE